MTCSYAEAIELTVAHESPISVPPWSADQPPNDGTTSPPSARSEAMSLAYGAFWGFAGRVRALSPSQASVHDVLLSVSRKARVKYRAPDCWASVVTLSVVHVSKYGE